MTDIHIRLQNAIYQVFCRHCTHPDCHVCDYSVTLEATTL